MINQSLTGHRRERSTPKGVSFIFAGFLLATAAVEVDAAFGTEFLGTKTLYEPQQKISSYEQPPAAYKPVFTEMVARHGARAATSNKDMEYIKQLIAFAVADNALTELGGELLPQVQSLEDANATLGFGNLSGLGAAEHQQLAIRLLQRLPALFRNAALTGRHVRIVNSGKDRAVDSGNDFAASLGTHNPPLRPFIDPPIVDTPLLYFFKLNPAYQDWVKCDPTLNQKLDDIFYSAQSHRHARRMLVRLFGPQFVDKLASGQFTFTDPQTHEPVVLNELDLGVSLYNLYQIAPGLEKEGTWDFAKFVPDGSARWFEYVDDSIEFYRKGPSFAGQTITFAMARVLEDDFFNAVGANCSPGGALAADLRFAHAETVIPFAALMQLPQSNRQVPASKTYTYAKNPWRGATVSPYAANIQWDAFSNDAGDCIVRMLYDEKQTRFKRECKSIRPTSFFYELDELKRCYGYE